MNLSEPNECSMAGCGAESKVPINWHREDYPRHYCRGHARDLASEYLDYLDEGVERLLEEVEQ